MNTEEKIFDFSCLDLSEANQVEQLKKILQFSRQFQRDWQELGVDRVYKYFDDVEGGWLDDF